MSHTVLTSLWWSGWGFILKRSAICERLNPGDKAEMFHRSGKNSIFSLYVYPVLHPLQTSTYYTLCTQYTRIRTPAFLYPLSRFLVFFLLSLCVWFMFMDSVAPNWYFSSWEGMPVQKGPTDHLKTGAKTSHAPFLAMGTKLYKIAVRCLVYAAQCPSF